MDNKEYKEPENEKNERSEMTDIKPKSGDTKEVLDDDFTFIPEDFNEIIQRFMESKDIEECVSLLKNIEFESTNARAAYSIVKDERGETTLLVFLLNIFHSEFPDEFSPHILRIFSNVMHVPGVHNFFIENNAPKLIEAIMHLKNPNSFEETCIFTKTNYLLTHEIVNFIMKLAETPGRFEVECEMIDFWSNFTTFLIAVLETDENDLCDCFTAILRITSKHNNLRSNYINNNIYTYCFRRFQRFSPDFIIVCRLLGQLTYYNDHALKYFPDDWISMISAKLEEVDDNGAVAILDSLMAFTTVTDICTALVHSNFISVLLDFSCEATFDLRKSALKLLLEIFIDNDDYHMFIDFLISEGSLDFFLPFMETENHEIMFNILDSLCHIISYAKVTQESGVPDLFIVFSESEDMMGLISDISEYTVDEDDPELEHSLVEAASLIISEMEENREIAESIAAAAK